MKSNIEKIRTFLFEAHKAGDRFVNLEKDMRPKDFDEAYEVQKQFLYWSSYHPINCILLLQ